MQPGGSAGPGESEFVAKSGGRELIQPRSYVRREVEGVTG